MTNENYKSDLYLNNMNELERKMFNAVFRRLKEYDEMELSDVFKYMSGFRIKDGSNEKVKLRMSKAFIRNWRRYKMVTVTKDKIRLGNIFIRADILDAENKALILESLGLIKDAEVLI